MMRPLSAAELLDAWEHAQTLRPVDRPLALLERALADDVGRDDLVAAGVGRRDAWLLELRELEFGPRVRGLASCAGCGAELESEFDVADVRAPFADSTVSHTVVVKGTQVTVRVPTSRDLAAVADIDDLARAARVLLERCIVSDAPTLEDPGRELLADAIADLDPQADVVLTLTCPNCAALARETFDVAEFLWIEVCSWAEQTLDDVDALARAYGWPEHEVLALSPWRRQRYVELVET
jgi:hypothetical protein